MRVRDRSTKMTMIYANSIIAVILMLLLYMYRFRCDAAAELFIHD